MILICALKCKRLASVQRGVCISNKQLHKLGLYGHFGFEPDPLFN